MRVLSELLSFKLAYVALSVVLISTSIEALPTSLSISWLFHAAYYAWSSGQAALHRKWTSHERPDWNMLYHLGGTGPWVQRIDGRGSESVVPPAGCQVEQTHLVSHRSRRLQGNNEWPRSWLTSVARCPGMPSDILHRRQEAVGQQSLLTTFLSLLRARNGGLRLRTRNDQSTQEN